MRARQIDSLTSLRFFAAALVVIFHSKQSFGGFAFFDDFSLTQAVSMFYVLSGFILAHTHKTITSGRELGMFYASRFARIWPLHLITAIAVILIMKHYNYSIPLRDSFLNFTLLQSWVPNQATYFSLNGVSWSLSNEIFFYAVFPLLILNIKNTWKIKLVTTIAITAMMLFAFKDSDGALMTWSTYISPLTRLSEFMLGIAAYQIYLKIFKVTHTPTASFSGFELVAIVIAAFAMWSPNLHLFSNLPAKLNTPVTIWFINCGGALAFAFLIIILAQQRGLISKALQARPLVYLGEISFALYMVHQVVIRLFDMYPFLTAGLSSASAFAAYYAASLLAAAIAHGLIEKPAQKVVLGVLGKFRSMPANTKKLDAQQRDI
ncbi:MULTISPECIES: acyltransferase family protein [Pseudomonas]|jgi:peptidoglycan/LPS O-acetylase OafA/YrhL|uniref:acyltransferase family protein n=1 Tax=Pseudomonas TaxID=286 RepID=UPI0010329D58|nr:MULTISPECIES: acyltransferase [Pseudomonas]MCI9873353.1 acyltransferase [Pseudomonas atacamensis]